MRAHKQREVIEQSLEKLETDYIDLYLIHWPVAGVFVESWKIMEEYYKKGVFRAIGVSNFHKQHLDELLAAAEITPAANQIELHPYLTQEPLVRLNEEKGIAVECWSPLGRGQVFGDETLETIAKRYDKTVSQVVLSWQIQRGLITIPKSVHKDRIIENFDVFGFELSHEDMNAISALNSGTRSMTGTDPDTFNF
jgi:diketogulonate reductase-like aldo/keto reductase